MYKCSICGNEENNLKIQVQEMMYGTREKFEYFQCANCGCLQIGKMPDDIKKYYPSNYYSFNNSLEKSAFTSILRRIRNRTAVLDRGIMGKLLYKLKPNIRLRSLSRLGLDTELRILDVGCGAGSLLCSLDDLGFKHLLGVDPFISEDIVVNDRLRIVKKELINVGGHWDVVMFHHSFEHILKQFETLQNVQNILEDNGTCLIRIPTVSSYAWRQYGVNWAQLDAPRHLFLHSVQSMEILSNRAGFFVEKVVFDSEDFQFWGSELYSKDIPLFDPQTRKPNTKATFFSARILNEYAAEADRLNADQDGDQAVFYLRKIAIDYVGDVKSIASKDKRSSSVLLPPAKELDGAQTVHQSTRFPNFFVVGAAKSGTSSICEYLRQHPEVYISPIKEPHYFSEDFRIADFRPDYRERTAFDIKSYVEHHPMPDKHIAHIEDQTQYLELFREVRNEKAIGELSAGYLYSSCAAENIFKFNPDAKIVMVLRQPVERAYSHYLMNVRDLWDYDSGFINALEHDCASRKKGWGKSHLYVELGMYFGQVRRYLDIFPRSQVKILFYEDLKSNPAAFMDDLFTFLDVDSKLSSELKFTEKNVASLPRIKIPNACLPILIVFRKYFGKRMSAKVKTQINKVMFSSNKVPKLRKEEFDQAMKYFIDDIQKLSDLIGRDLSGWYRW